MMEFLNLKELVPLTKLDIDVDLHELRGLIDDSDSSVSSSEVLTSHYPVKPRKTLAPKRDYDPRYDEYSFNLAGSRDVNNDQVEEALVAVKALLSSRKDLAEMEAAREELECLQESYEMNYQYQQRSFLDQKQELASYFRALQGMFLRKMKSYQTNRTYYLSADKLHHQLVELRQCNAATAEAISTIKAKIGKPKKGGTNQAHDLFTGNNPVAVKVSVAQANREVLLVVGQRVLTPFGAATISIIDNSSKKATLALPFGQLYTTLPQLVIWVVSAESKFQNTVEEVKGIASQGSKAFHLQSFFLPLTNSTTSSASAGNGSSIAETEVKDDASLTENANLSEMEVVSNAGGGTDTSVKDDGASEDMDTSTLLESTTGGGEGNHSSSNGSKGVFNTGAKESVSLPIPKHVARIYEQNQHDLFQQRATLPIAPIDAVPDLIAEFRRKEEVHSHAKITLDLTSTQQQPELNQRVTSRLLPHDQLASQFEEVTNNVRNLQAKERFLLSKLEQLRSESGRLSTMTSNIRLGMFTRRIAHRNFLNSKGFATNLFLPTGSSTARGGFKGNSSSSAASSSAASALLSMSLLASAAASAQVNNGSSVNGVSVAAVKSEGGGAGGRGSAGDRRGGKGKGKGVAEETVSVAAADLSSPVTAKYETASDVTTGNGEVARKRGREEAGMDKEKEKEKEKDKESENNESNGEDNNTTGTSSQKKKARRRRY